MNANHTSAAAETIEYVLTEFDRLWADLKVDYPHWVSRLALCTLLAGMYFLWEFALLATTPGPLFADPNWFFTSFWPGLASGFGYSLPTGIIVGLVVVWALDRTRCRRELATLIGHLRSSLSRPNAWGSETAKAGIPLGADAVGNLLEGAATDLWREKLPRERTFIDLLLDFQKAYWNLASLAEQADARGDALIREMMEKETFVPTDADVRQVRWLVVRQVRDQLQGGRLKFHGFEVAVAHSFGGRGFVFDPVLRDEGLNRLADELFDAAKRVEMYLAEIRKALDARQDTPQAG